MGLVYLEDSVALRGQILFKLWFGLGPLLCSLLAQTRPGFRNAASAP